ncbi:hypothetical protein D3C86_1629100 [compost metagenome]
MPGHGHQQTARQLQAGMAVVADHRAEAGRVHGPVDTNHRQALGLQFRVGVIAGRQATGDEQGIAAARTEQLLQLPFAVGVVVAAGDQQLIALGPGPLLELFGDARVAGVFQVRQDETQGARMPAAQARRLRVGRKAVLLDHRPHPLHGAVADALLFGLAIDDIAGSGNRHTGQAGDIAEFQAKIPFDAMG